MAEPTTTAGGISIAAVLIALLGPLAVGAGKELHDYMRQETNTPDIWDFIATAVGAVIGATPFLLR